MTDFDWIISDTLQYLELFNFVDILNWIVWNRTCDNILAGQSPQSQPSKPAHGHPIV